MKISLKELRETLIWLKIIVRKRMGDLDQVQTAIAECGELVARLTTKKQGHPQQKNKDTLSLVLTDKKNKRKKTRGAGQKS